MAPHNRTDYSAIARPQFGPTGLRVGLLPVAAILVFSLAWLPAAPAFAAAAFANSAFANAFAGALRHATPAAAAVRPHAAAKAKPAAPTPISEFSLHCPLKFITGICTDGPHRIWISGEDHGLYAGKIKYRHLHLQSHPSAAAITHSLILSNDDLHIHWYHFDKANSPGLASNFITAIDVDGKGRLWAGTDRHGVCVFNGKHWKHYSILNGPLGCHVYAIAYDPAADQVWIATENGISIYQCGHDAGAVTGAGASRAVHPPGSARAVPRYSPRTWHYITSINKLPPNPDCMAFNSRGTAFVGTLCNGLAIGRPIMKASGPPGAMFAVSKLTYRWRIVTGPWHMPLTATGYGLPSNLINCVLVGARHGHIYVGTDLGLAISTNDGESFHYIRGSDYAAKVMGLWHPPVGYRPPPESFLNKLLPGDHITTLAQDAKGRIWVGTWRNGYAVLKVRTGQMMRSEDEPGLSKQDGYINRLCPLVLGAVGRQGRRGDGRSGAIGAGRVGPDTPPSANETTNEKIMEAMLIGRYGFGVHGFAGAIRGERRATAGAAGNAVASAALATINPTQFRLPAYAKPPTVAQLTAMRRKLRRLPRFASRNFRAAYLGADWATRGDWFGRYGRQYGVLCGACSPASLILGWGNYYAMSASLGIGASPSGRMRAWIEWRRTSDGRVLWDPEKGCRRQAENDDHGEAHSRNQQGPGLLLAIRIPAGIQMVSLYFVNYNGHSGAMRRRDFQLAIYRERPRAGGALMERPLAEARVCGFWGGVYQRFLLRGPGRYALAINRNHSLNASVSGIFFDRLDGPRLPTDAIAPPWTGSVCWPPEAMGPPVPVGPAAELALRCQRGPFPVPASVVPAAGVIAYRAVESLGGLHRWPLRRVAGIWTARDAANFSSLSRSAWLSFSRGGLHGARLSSR